MLDAPDAGQAAEVFSGMVVGPDMSDKDARWPLLEEAEPAIRDRMRTPERPIAPDVSRDTPNVSRTSVSVA